MKKTAVITEYHLQESEERFRTMADHTSILIAMGDQTSNATYFNKAWVKLTGRPMKDLLQFGWADLVHPEDRAIYVRLYLGHFQKKEPFTGEFRIRNKDGSYTWLFAQNQPRIRADQTFAGFISSCIDISDRKKAEEALKAEKMKQEILMTIRTKELQRSNDDLQQFVHVISHDLREPARKMKVILSRLEFELGDALPDKAKYYIAKTNLAADRMLNMIEGVLNYSSLNEVESLIKRVDLNTVLQDILSDLELVIVEKKAIIQSTGLPIIEGIPMMLYQLLYNLVNNSLKFARAGVAPVISLTSHMSVRNGKRTARLEVADNGIGFESENAGKIFDPFVRLHSKDKYDGTGLGLALCKKIAERHAGKIEAKIQQGPGATFVVTLPLRYQTSPVKHVPVTSTAETNKKSRP
jgi:PAS domain S-box-containing protein